MELTKRPRRLRGSENLRKMVRETRMDKSSLMYPMFVMEGENKEEEIPSMTGQYRYSLDRLPYKLEQLSKAGVGSVMFFGIPDHKDEVGSGAYDSEGIVQRALRIAKEKFPELYYVTDVCMCEYTSQGHCGVLCGHDVDNDKTLDLLAKTALSHVEAGADMVAPSDMMDGRVAAIRECLDKAGHYTTPIMSYAVKYASAFYGPFREAADSAPSFGDRKTYQMDFHNKREGIKEALLDVEEGADIIMVKPAMAYQDVITECIIHPEYSSIRIEYRIRNGKIFQHPFLDLGILGCKRNHLTENKRTVTQHQNRHQNPISGSKTKYQKSCFHIDRKNQNIQHHK